MFGQAIEAVVLPVAFSLHSVLVQVDSTSCADPLEVQALEGRSVWLEPSSVSGGASVLEHSLVHPVVGEHHSAQAFWLPEFV